jgi:MoxR-like ATPase
MKIELGYPSRAAEREILLGPDRDQLIHAAAPCLDVDSLRAAQAEVLNVQVSDAFLDYVQNLVEFSRSKLGGGSGLSPRAAKALVRCSQAWAYLHGRRFCIPDDLQATAVAVINHRLTSIEDPQAEFGRKRAQELVDNVKVDL